MDFGSYQSRRFRQSYEWQLVFHVTADSRERLVPYLIAANSSYSLSLFNGEIAAVEELGQALAASLGIPFSFVENYAPSPESEAR